MGYRYSFVEEHMLTMLGWILSTPQKLCIEHMTYLYSLIQGEWLDIVVFIEWMYEWVNENSALNKKHQADTLHFVGIFWEFLQWIQGN
jgi:hypothetical protein